MRKRWMITILITMFNYVGSYSQSVSTVANNKGLNRRVSRKKPSYKFQEQLTRIAFESIKISDGLRQEDAQKVKDRALIVMDKLFQFDARVLSNKSNYSWYMHKIKMALSIKRVYNAGTIKNQKVLFDEFNRELYKSIISYGISGDKLFYQGCLNAFDNHSGYWFSASSVIRNPYLNNTKSNCGFVAVKFQ